MASDQIRTVLGRMASDQIRTVLSRMASDRTGIRIWFYMAHEKKERLVLIAVDYGQDYSPKRSLDELALLVETAGAQAIEKVVQKMDSPSPATYLGSGKVEELKWILEGEEADGIVADDELSPAQMRNLGEILDTKVLDRTSVILDIFAQHARSNEGKIQVEMAQLEYRNILLSGSSGMRLSRQGGGIGSRGPGETQLETDRRVIRSRMATLRRSIKEMEKNREIARKMRTRNALPVVAIVGYTNAGKSTLLNHITDSSVLEENKLFATLDPTTRSGILPDGQKLLFTDTVGFIHKLPHHLVKAFHSTLEEAAYADVILHVVDSADPEIDMHMQVVYDTLEELKISGKPMITVFNKSDLLQTAMGGKRDPHAQEVVRVSALTGQGMEELYAVLSKTLKELRVYIDQVIPYAKGALVSRIHEQGQIVSEEYEEAGVHIKAYVPAALAPGDE